VDFQFKNFNGNVLRCLLEKTAMQKMVHKKNIRMDMTNVRILWFVFDWPLSDVIHAKSWNRFTAPTTLK